MTKSIYIDPKELRAVFAFAADKDIRYYLNGVLVQATAHQTRIVATDGHILGMFDHAFQNEGVTLEEFIIPRDIIKRLKPIETVPLEVRITDSEYRIQQLPDDAFIFKPVDSKFPDYARIIPTSANAEYAQFNGGLIAKIDKAQKLFSTKGLPFIWHNGLGGALFKLSGNLRFAGVIMPFSADARSRTLPFPDVSIFKRPLEPVGVEPTFVGPLRPDVHMVVPTPASRAGRKPGRPRKTAKHTRAVPATN